MKFSLARSSMFFLVLASVLLLCGQASAENISMKFDHALGMGSNSKSYEHRIDIPDEWAMKKIYMDGRSVKTDGDLVVEREELKPNYYYVKVRLVKGWWGSAKGSVHINISGSSVLPGSPAPGACSNLKASDPGNMPNLSWNGLGKYTAVSLMDISSGRTIWERVILGKTSCKMDESYLTVNHRYFFAAKQSDDAGRYSPEAKISFKIGTREETCGACNGAGWFRCNFCHGTGHIGGPNGWQMCSNCGGTGRERCTQCMGDGKIDIPIIVNE